MTYKNRLLLYQDFVTKYGERPPDIVCAITRIDTLKEVGEWLEKKLQGESCAFIYDSNDLGLKAFVKILLRGEMPKEVKE